MHSRVVPQAVPARCKPGGGQSAEQSTCAAEALRGAMALPPRALLVSEHQEQVQPPPGQPLAWPQLPLVRASQLWAQLQVVRERPWPPPARELLPSQVLLFLLVLLLPALLLQWPASRLRYPVLPVLPPKQV
jgi:hypothetical protein